MKEKKFYLIFIRRSNLPALVRERQNAILSLLWGTLAEASRALIRPQVFTPVEYPPSFDEHGNSRGNFTEIYQLLYDFFGDSLCTVPLGKLRQSRRIRAIPEKDIVGKLKIRGLPGREAKRRNPSGTITSKLRR